MTHVNTDDGWIEFTIEEGRTIRFGANDDGTLDIRVETPGGTVKDTTINPDGGSTALGQ